MISLVICSLVLIASVSAWTWFNRHELDLFSVRVIFLAVYFGIYTLLDVLVKGAPYVEADIVILMYGLIGLHLVTFVLLRGLMKAVAGDGKRYDIDSLLEGVEKIDHRPLTALLFIPLLVKAYGAWRYGMIGDYLLSTEYANQIPYWFKVASISSMFVMPAFIIDLIKRFRGIATSLLFELLLAGNIGLIVLIGGRRNFFTFLFIALLLAYVSGWYVRFKKPRNLLAAALVLVAFIWFADYFPAVRQNFSQPKYIVAIQTGTVSQKIDAVWKIFSERSDSAVGRALSRNLEERQAMWQFNYNLLEEQVRGRAEPMRGEATLTVLSNVVPKVLNPEKRVVDIDKRVSRRFNLIIKDQPTNGMAVMNADYSYFGYIIWTIVLAAFIFLETLLIRMFKHHRMIVLVVLAGAFSWLMDIEASLESLFLVFRNDLIFIAVALVVSFFISAARSGSIRLPTGERSGQ